MNAPQHSESASRLTNGSGAAALLAASIGTIALAVLAIVGDKISTAKSLLNFYHPTGPLSGVTTSAIVLWLIVWALLEWRWRLKSVAFSKVSFAAFLLLAPKLSAHVSADCRSILTQSRWGFVANIRFHI